MYMCVYIDVYRYRYTYTCAYKHAYIHIRMCIDMHTLVYACVIMCVLCKRHNSIYMCVHIYAQIVCVRSHACLPLPPLFADGRVANMFEGATGRLIHMFNNNNQNNNKAETPFQSPKLVR